MPVKLYSDCTLTLCPVTAFPMLVRMVVGSCFWRLHAPTISYKIVFILCSMCFGRLRRCAMQESDHLFF